MMDDLEKLIADPALIGREFSYEDKSYKIEKADNFEYTDPIDGTVTKKQVLTF